MPQELFFQQSALLKVLNNNSLLQVVQQIVNWIWEYRFCCDRRCCTILICCYDGSRQACLLEDWKLCALFVESGALFFRALFEFDCIT